MFLTEATTKRDAAKAFALAVKAARKGPHINLGRPITEDDHRWYARYEMREAGKRTHFSRARRRFCVAALDQLRGLPRCTSETKGCGVYFLWYGPVLLYVGKSRCIGDRLFQHRKENAKPFTHATFMSGPDDLIRSFEADYVRRYAPPYNFTSTG